MGRVVPTINTARLTLRAMTLSDFDRYAQLWADARVVGDIGVPLRDRAESWGAFLKNAGHWQLMGYGQWAIEPHRAGQIAGHVGFFQAKRDWGADFDAYPEAGWVLGPTAQGQGFGPEAANAAHDWFDRVVTGPLVCVVAHENARSLALAERLGYTALRDSPDGSAVLMLRRRAPEGGPLSGGIN
ncbi:MAG: GNAT family N-acetyltransferase [Pseudomonadota bacterium]